MLTKVEAARQKYLPESIRYLLVAEAPPREDSNRFFYYENVSTQDSLFLETMKVLYPQDAVDAKDVRQRKQSFLDRFKRDRFFLVDSLDKPITDSSKKDVEIRRALPSLLDRLHALAKSNEKIILISAPVYRVCTQALIADGFNVINDEMIDFPGSGRQVVFRKKFGELLRKHGYS